MTVISHTHQGSFTTNVEHCPFSAPTELLSEDGAIKSIHGALTCEGTGIASYIGDHSEQTVSGTVDKCQ